MNETTQEKLQIVENVEGNAGRESGEATRLAPVRLRVRTYSAPRKFDMATMFVVMIVYSSMLGAMTALEWNRIAIVCILGFVTAVGASQALFFGGRGPRIASLISGGVLLPLIVLTLLLMDKREVSIFYAVAASILAIPLGVFLGYLSGAMVGGVFLVADHLRVGRGVME